MFSGKRGPVLLLGEKMGMWSTRWTLRLGAEGVWCVLAHHGHFDDRRRVRTPMARLNRRCDDTSSNAGYKARNCRCHANKHSTRERRLEEPSHV